MTRLEILEDAIKKHREEKALTPMCTCWINDAEKLDRTLYECLNYSGEDRVAYLENAIRKNLDSKKPIRECRCFANAPQMIDEELAKALKQIED